MPSQQAEQAMSAACTKVDCGGVAVGRPADGAVAVGGTAMADRAGEGVGPGAGGGGAAPATPTATVVACSPCARVIPTRRTLTTSSREVVPMRRGVVILGVRSSSTVSLGVGCVSREDSHEHLAGTGTVGWGGHWRA